MNLRSFCLLTAIILFPALCLAAPDVPQTGQTTQYAGDLRSGVPLPCPRFTDNGDGTVLDNLTGLVWLRDANCIKTQYSGFDTDNTAGDGKVTWSHALDFVAGINGGTYPLCGAGQTDWRLPTVNELWSLINFAYSDPALSDAAGTGHWTEGDPFNHVVSNDYWSGTTYAYQGGGSAWYVRLLDGYAWALYKGFDGYVWPVRGGQ